MEKETGPVVKGSCTSSSRKAFLELTIILTSRLFVLEH